MNLNQHLINEELKENLRIKLYKLVKFDVTNPDSPYYYLSHENIQESLTESDISKKISEMFESGSDERVGMLIKENSLNYWINYVKNLI